MVIRVIIDGEKIVYVNNEQQPLIRNQRTMVPVHSVFEKLGFDVVWIPGAGYNPKGRLRIYNNRYHIVINEDEETFTINGRTYYHPHGVPAQIIGGRVMILLRELLEQTGHWVGWDSSTHTVYIYSVLSGYFKIRNADGKYLTYVGKSNDPITVESANDAATQIWKIERSPEENKYHIRPAKFSTLAMNVYRSGDYPCTIQPTAGNIEDTSFNIGRVQDLNCTVNWGGTHYLTESSDKAYWTETDTPQEWTLEPTSYTPPEPSNCIELPYNISQFYYKDLLASKCAGVCAMDISIYYRNMKLSNDTDLANSLYEEIVKLYNCTYFMMENENTSKKCMFDSNGYLMWNNVYGVGFNINFKNGPVSKDIIYEKAVESIQSRAPMMIHYYGRTDGPDSAYKEHWVIPVAYDPNDKSHDIDSLLVCDPYTRETTCINTAWTLKSSREYNAKDVSSFNYGYVTTYPR